MIVMIMYICLYEDDQFYLFDSFNPVRIHVELILMIIEAEENFRFRVFSRVSLDGPFLG